MIDCLLIRFYNYRYSKKSHQNQIHIFVNVI
jgi:hypothetical protein